VTIKIKGPIIESEEAWIYDWFDMDYTTASKVEEYLQEASGAITVVINSPGGSVYEADEIYHMLRKYGATNKVTIEIVGIAASAASYIATASDDVAISPGAQIMIHNASVVSRGDYRDMDKTSEILQKINRSIVNVYMLKTELSEKELLDMMDEETYLGAQEALDKGFVDRILHTDGQMKFAASKNGADNGFLPNDVIEKMKNQASSFMKNDTMPITIDKNEDLQNKQNKKGGEESVTYEEIKNQHPEIFEKIKNEGHAEGVKEENERIKSIDALSQVGMESLINNAKYEEPINSGQLAIKILNKQKEIGQQHIKNVEDDAEALNEVEDKSPDNKKEEEEAQVLAKSAETLNDIFDGGVL